MPLVFTSKTRFCLFRSIVPQVKSPQANLRLSLHLRHQSIICLNILNILMSFRVWLERQFLQPNSEAVADIERFVNKLFLKMPPLKKQGKDYLGSIWIGFRRLPVYAMNLDYDGAYNRNAPPRNRTPSCRFVVCRAIRYTCRASVSTRNRTWIRTFGGSCAILCTIETFSVPTWSRTRARALGEPRAIRYTIGTDKPEPTTGFAPA